ncbi:MAG: archaetidylinositol phosphate synthase [Sulfolobaceae archaeon]
MITRLRKIAKRVLSPIALVFIRIGFSANQITILGLILSFLYFLFLYFIKFYIICFILILLSALMDAIDGEVARIKGTAGAFGSFFDSVIDRVEDIIYILPLGVLGVPWEIVSGLIGSSLLISYIRAKAESLGIRMEGKGLIERGERIIIIAIAILVYSYSKVIFDIILYILLLLSIFTVIQRFKYVINNIRSNKAVRG